MKHWEQTVATYVYNHCNICNIPIYFCNIRMKHLKHTYETSKTLETCTCNMGEPRDGRFQPLGSELVPREPRAGLGRADSAHDGRE